MEKIEMSAEEYLKWKNIMTDYCRIRCSDCSLRKAANGFSSCESHLIEAIAIVAKYKAEHSKTYKQDFLEKFPKAKIEWICPIDVFDFECEFNCGEECENESFQKCGDCPKWGLPCEEVEE